MHYLRYITCVVISATLLMGELALASASTPTNAQAQNTAQEKAASLRAQLSEVETKQAELQTRLQKLEEDLKPENIEQNLAGIGSTRPEDLREQRRRQLEIERNGVQAQLNLLATSHTRLETAIAQAEAEAYRQSAAPVITAPSTNPAPTTAEATGGATIPARPRRVKRKKRKKSKPSVSANPWVETLRSSRGGGEV
jgi:hypothetical protein